MTERKVGTFCVVIQQRLAVTNCPLPIGTCFWKHRVTGQCRYSENTTDMNIFDLAKLVGLPIPTEVHIIETKQRLLTAIQSELKGA